MIKNFVKKLLLNKLINLFFLKYFLVIYLKFLAIRHGLCLTSSNGILFLRDNKTRKQINFSRKHIIYGSDYIMFFDYYFSSVASTEIDSFEVVDFSSPSFHKVTGYDLHPVFFNSASEPLITTNQYLDFAKLKKSDVVIDLGAYSGLVSLVFKKIIGHTGTVIAVEADSNNIISIKKNLKLFKKITNMTIHLFQGAIYKDCKGVLFASEGNMGSSLKDILGFRSQNITSKVKSINLSGLAKKYKLDKVDFIKCDIEGGEKYIFNDDEFFKKFKPKIIVEPHYINGKMTDIEVIKQLKKYNYKVKRIKQKGVVLPLLQFYYSK